MQLQTERGIRIMWEQQLCSHQGSEGRGCASGNRAELPTECGEVCGGAGCPLQSTEVHSRDPPAYHGVPMVEEFVPEGLGPAEEAHVGTVPRIAACRRNACWRSSWKTASNGKDPTLKQGKSVRSLPTEEEGAAETTCDEVTKPSVSAALLQRQR